MKEIFSKTLIVLILLFTNSIGAEEKTKILPLDLTTWTWYAKEGFEKNYLVDVDSFQPEEYKQIDNFPILLNNVFVNPVGPVSVKEYTLFCKFSLNIDRIHPGKELAMFFAGIGESWEIYINGEKVRSEYWKEGDTIRRYRAVRNHSVSLPYGILKENNLLVIRIAGYTPVTPINQNTMFGLRFKSGYYIDYEKNILHANQQLSLLTLNSIYVFFGLYHLFFFIRWPQKKYNLYFALFSLCISCYFLAFSNLAFEVIQDTRILIFLAFFSQPVALLSFLFFVYDYFTPERKYNFALKSSLYSTIFISLLFIGLKIYYFNSILYFWYVFALPQLLYVLFYIFRAIRLGLKDAIPMGVSISIMMLAVFWEMLDTILFKTGIRVLQFAYSSFILSLILILANRFIEINWETKRLNVELTKQRDSFLKFVPTQFLEVLGKRSAAEIAIGECNLHEMTILFSDIRDFTFLSESMTPEQNFRFINSYLRRMGPIIEKNKGFIDKFIGDAIMAIFFTPQDAINASIQMIQELEIFNEGRKRAGYTPIRVGIGVNTGMLMMGTVGHEDRFNTTVIGDAVNIAARLESATKIYKSSILLTENSFAKLGPNHNFHIRPIDFVQVKGKTGKIKVFECFDIDSETQIALKEESLELLENAILFLENKKLHMAITYWKKILQINPADRIARYHLDQQKSEIIGISP